MAEKYWIYGNNQRIPVSKMTLDHLQNAFTNVAQREFEDYERAKAIYARIAKFDSLKMMLTEELNNRGQEPVYPDQKYDPSIYRGYFEDQRKTKIMTPTEMDIIENRVKAVLFPKEG